MLTKNLYFTTVLLLLSVTVVLILSLLSPSWKSTSLTPEDVAKYNLSEFLTKEEFYLFANHTWLAQAGAWKLSFEVGGFINVGIFSITLEGRLLIVGLALFSLGVILFIFSFYEMNLDEMKNSTLASKLLCKSGSGLTRGGAGVLIAGMIAFSFKKKDWNESRGVLDYVFTEVSNVNFIMDDGEENELIKKLMLDWANKPVQNGWAYILCWLMSVASLVVGIMTYFVSDKMGKIEDEDDIEYDQPSENQV